MRLSACSYFAQQLAPVTPLPSGPTLSLPAGKLDVLENGRVLCVQHLIIAVGLSDKLFLVVEPRDGRLMSPRLLDQLVGYLIACGCQVVRLEFRCPLRWHHLGSLELTREIWALAYLDAGHPEQWFVVVLHELGLNVALPLRAVAMNGSEFWEAAMVVMDAIGPTDTSAMRRVRSVLMRFSRDWEHDWHQQILRAHLDQTTTVEDWAAAQACEGAWTAVVRNHLAPHGYQVQPASLARLL